MKVDRRIGILAATLCIAVHVSAASAEEEQPGPTYADETTQRVIEAMVSAHGGFQPWISAPSFRFTANMYLSSLPVSDGRTWGDNWRFYTVKVVPASSRGTVELPLEAGDGPVIAFDGSDVWARPYEFDATFRDGPLQLLYYHYAMVSLPWLTQFPEVSLSSLEPASLPDSSERLNVVEMSFDPEIGAEGAFFRLYIDPETKLLQGFSHTTTYPFLPGAPLPPLELSRTPAGMFRIIESFVEVDGLVVPRAYSTVLATDEGIRLLGAHLVVDPSFSEEMDEKQLVRPADAALVTESD